MRRLIATRKAYKALAGTTHLPPPGQPKDSCISRDYQGEYLLCVANLANSAQPVELDLAAYKGRAGVLGRTVFPAIGELPIFEFAKLQFLLVPVGGRCRSACLARG